MTRPNTVKNDKFKNARLQRWHTGRWLDVEDHLVEVCAYVYRVVMILCQCALCRHIFVLNCIVSFKLSF